MNGVAMPRSAPVLRSGSVRVVRRDDGMVVLSCEKFDFVMTPLQAVRLGEALFEKAGVELRRVE